MSANFISKLDGSSKGNLVIDELSADNIEKDLVQLHNRFLNKDTTTLVGNFWNEISTASPAKQVAIGGVSGWCTGYAVGKIGKLVLITLGGGILVLQLAQSQGLIKIDWKAIEKKAAKTQEKVKTQFSNSLPSFIEQIKHHGARHIYLSGSFCLGLFFGIFV